MVFLDNDDGMRYCFGRYSGSDNNGPNYSGMLIAAIIVGTILYSCSSEEKIKKKVTLEK